MTTVQVHQQVMAIHLGPQTYLMQARTITTTGTTTTAVSSSSSNPQKTPGEKAGENKGKINVLGRDNETYYTSAPDKNGKRYIWKKQKEFIEVSDNEEEEEIKLEDKTPEVEEEVTEEPEEEVTEEPEEIKLEEEETEIIEFDKETIKKLESIFKRADLIKFAKMREQEGQAKVDRSVVEEIINETKEIIPEPTEEELLEDKIYLEKLRKKQQRRKVFITVFR